MRGSITRRVKGLQLRRRRRHCAVSVLGMLLRNGVVLLVMFLEIVTMFWF